MRARTILERRGNAESMLWLVACVLISALLATASAACLVRYAIELEFDFAIRRTLDVGEEHKSGPLCVCDASVGFITRPASHNWPRTSGHCIVSSAPLLATSDRWPSRLIGRPRMPSVRPVPRVRSAIRRRLAPGPGHAAADGGRVGRGDEDGVPVDHPRTCNAPECAHEVKRNEMAIGTAAGMRVVVVRLWLLLDSASVLLTARRAAQHRC